MNIRLQCLPLLLCVGLMGCGSSDDADDSPQPDAISDTQISGADSASANDAEDAETDDILTGPELLSSDVATQSDSATNPEDGVAADDATTHEDTSVDTVAAVEDSESSDTTPVIDPTDIVDEGQADSAPLVDTTEEPDTTEPDSSVSVELPCGGCPDETFCVQGSCTAGRYSFVETVVGPSVHAECMGKSDPNQPVCWPAGMVVSPTGRLYIADGGNHRIRIYENGSLITLAGLAVTGDLDGSTNEALFDQPTGLALDGEGLLYVADYGNHKIRTVTDDTVSTFAGTGVQGWVDGPVATAQFTNPYMLARAADGALYVTDTGNYRIRKIHDGEVTTIAGDGESGFLDGPADTARFGTLSGIVVDSIGRVFVADTTNRRIRMIADGVVSTFAGPDFPEPPCDTVDDCADPGHVCYANVCRASCAGDGQCEAGDICISDACISPVQGWIEGDPHDARFGEPRGLAIDAADNLYVTDMSAHRIRIIRTSAPAFVQSAAGVGSYLSCSADGDCCSGNADCFTGICSYGDCQQQNWVGMPPPTFGGYVNGATDSAKFDSPITVAVDPSTGRLFVSDLLNQAIRMVLP